MHYVWGIPCQENYSHGIYRMSVSKIQTFIARCCRCDRGACVYSVARFPLTIVTSRLEHKNKKTLFRVGTYKTKQH